jgi:hypothetical protein
VSYSTAMNRRTILLLAAFAFVFGAGTFGCSKSKLKELTVDEVAARIAANDGKTFVYDNNGKDRYDKSHVPGAKWLDEDKVTAADLPADKSATLVFYCANDF